MNFRLFLVATLIFTIVSCNLPVEERISNGVPEGQKTLLTEDSEFTKEEAMEIFAKSFELQKVEGDVPTIPGFKYLKSSKYSSGGVTHTIHEYLHEETTLEFVLVPGGTFQMGSPEDEPFRASDEGPMRTVRVRSFLMSKYEVNQKVWTDVMAEEPWFRKGQRRSYTQVGPDYPATFITWDAAREFCEKTGLDLPTEAQWEYACRAGTQTLFYWGEEMSDEHCWHYGNAWDVEDKEDPEEALKCAREIGRKKPNAFGLFDIIGNVSEWCQDMYFNNYKNAPEDESPRYGEGPIRVNRVHLVYRGGSFAQDEHFCRSASRYLGPRSYKDCFVGFRVRGPILDE